MNTLKFCFKFSDNSDTMIFWIIKYIRTLLQYEYKRKTIFQHSIFFTVAELFLALPLFFTQKNLVCTTIPWLFNSLNELKFQKQQIFTYIKWFTNKSEYRSISKCEIGCYWNSHYLKGGLQKSISKVHNVPENWGILAN